MAVPRLRARALSLILCSTSCCAAPHASPLVSLHHLLSSASSVSSPVPFVAEDYLVSRCGLTPAQALKAAKRISHLRSPSKPDAVLAFLHGTLGVPAADIAAAVAMDPKILCLDVERALAARVADLSNLGLSLDEIARLISLAPNSFRSRFLSCKVEFWLKEMGSFDKLVRVLRMNSGILTSDPDKVFKPNLALLQQCGLNASDLVVMNNLYSARPFTMNPKHLREAVELVEELGVERGTRMFLYMLVVVCLKSKEAVAGRIQFLQKIGFSQDDARKIVRKAPAVLGSSVQKVQGNFDFLMKDVGLDAPYIARRPVLLLYSVERRLLPRHRLLKVLREKGLLIVEFDYYFTVAMSEKLFVQKFVLPYKDVVPGLADGYASNCSEKAVDRVS